MRDVLPKAFHTNVVLLLKPVPILLELWCYNFCPFFKLNQTFLLVVFTDTLESGGIFSWVCQPTRVDLVSDWLFMSFSIVHVLLYSQIKKSQCLVCLRCVRISISRQGTVRNCIYSINVLRLTRTWILWGVSKDFWLLIHPSWHTHHILVPLLQMFSPMCLFCLTCNLVKWWWYRRLTVQFSRSETTFLVLNLIICKPFF